MLASYAIAEATFFARVNPIKTGLAEPTDGKRDRSATYALLMW
jgi:hypothetical protein